MSSVIVIQARTSSSRLPAKVLLTIQSIPLVVMVALRAANKGKTTVVVTSTDDSDDILCDTLEKHNIDYFRGSLNNTLDRFISALTGFPDETIVFRLTADNVFPDGDLIQSIEDQFITQGVSYMACNGVDSGLPYGVSVEVFRLSSLRQAHRETTSQFDQEHVTPYVRRNEGVHFFTSYLSLEAGVYRATIDTFDDYQLISRVFKNTDDPVNVGCMELVSKLKSVDTCTFVNTPASKLVLGGAQLGMDYGINNQVGMPGQSQADEILKTAVSNGVEMIDTASAYGKSESVVGKALANGWSSRAKVITKLATLDEFDDSADSLCISTAVKSSVIGSCKNLQLDQLFCLMLHRVAHLNKWNGTVWQTLKQLKAEGFINFLGASVQSPAELIECLRVEDISYIQMPFNVLDYRWVEAIDMIKEIKKNRHLHIHARSALLQGVLATDDDSVWHRIGVNRAAEYVQWLKQNADLYGFESTAGFAISYVRSQDWVDGVVVGIDNMDQLKANIQIFTERLLGDRQLLSIDRCRPKIIEHSLDPSNWS